MLHTQAPLMRTFILACSGVRLSTAQGEPVELIEAIQRRTVDLPSHYLGNGLTSVAQLDNLALEVVGGQVWLAAHADDEDIADVRVRFDTIGIYEALMRSISPLAHATASLAVGSKFPFGN